jgi:hypothetical protein
MKTANNTLMDACTLLFSNHTDVPTSLVSVAELLINTCELQIGTRTFELAEVEAYLWTSSHKDPFVYREPNAKFGQLFFHASGVDIWLGLGESRLGWLVRAVYERSSDTYIYGPLIIKGVIEEELKLQLTKSAVQSYYSLEQDWPINLIESEQERNDHIFRATRWKLGERTHDPDGYKLRDYRFFTHPSKEHKGKESFLKDALSKQILTSEEIYIHFKRTIK